jgi:hypothetical protein
MSLFYEYKIGVWMDFVVTAYVLYIRVEESSLRIVLYRAKNRK